MQDITDGAADMQLRVTRAAESVIQNGHMKSALHQLDDAAASAFVHSERRERGETATAIRKLNELDPSQVANTDGLKIVVDAMNASSSEMTDAEHGECFEQGCILLMSLAGEALDGSGPCRDALLRYKAAEAMMCGLARHSGGAAAALELGEAGAAALMQLA